MKNWWKSPVLQGPENDYGEYDYLIEDIPSYEEKWSWYFEKCSSCGKEHYLNLGATSYFRTMDGWDSNYCCECWRCYLKRKIKTPFRAIKKKISRFVKAKKEYDFMMQAAKKSNCPLTKELKKTLKQIAKREGTRRN